MKVGQILLGIALAAGIAAECYGQTARSFAIRVVYETVKGSQQGPPDDDLVPTAEGIDDPNKALWLKRDGQLGSEALADAYACIDLRAGKPVVQITLTPAAVTSFAELTRQNIARRIAIVVNGKVIVAPVVRQPILDGKIQIVGDQTVAQSQALAAEMLGVALSTPPPAPKPCPGSVPNYRRVG